MFEVTLRKTAEFIFAVDSLGAEELISLTKQGISTEVIPGISSAVSGPLMANIPITARDYSNVFTVVSAHLKDNSINLEWVPMLENKNHTVIVLMGLTRIPDIIRQAKKLDIDMDTLCAIISNASRKNQSVQVGTLDNINVLSLKAKRPAIIVFGKVVDFLQELEKYLIH
ncbi:uroporphyrinogen-III C-methyltransferase [Sulfurovum mangrovi]|uniref:uroporphyrinogen-III C-methyltransferase n=1 Tax=Sulfurovum mangrovi TaxID=2893889 RepID=UPI001E32075D|nr:SAM-dependent methyltransferase [Sulfurovum mangrovi]UFH59628.1 SAM-dependent methyltransferase [Sulfurovum mangrovi]